MHCIHLCNRPSETALYNKRVLKYNTDSIKCLVFFHSNAAEIWHFQHLKNCCSCVFWPWAIIIFVLLYSFSRSFKKSPQRAANKETTSNHITCVCLWEQGRKAVPVNEFQRLHHSFVIFAWKQTFFFKQDLVYLRHRSLQTEAVVWHKEALEFWPNEYFITDVSRDRPVYSPFDLWTLPVRM